jgi:hypothetical protein
MNFFLKILLLYREVELVTTLKHFFDVLYSCFLFICFFLSKERAYRVNAFIYMFNISKREESVFIDFNKLIIIYNYHHDYAMFRDDNFSFLIFFSEKRFMKSINAKKKFFSFKVKAFFQIKGYFKNSSFLEK